MQPQMDGTIDSAVASMPDFDDLVPFEQARDGQVPQRRDQNREPNGRFTAEEQAALDAVRGRNAPPPGPKTRDAEAAEAKAAEDAAASTPAEEFFELPPDEEGGEPKRIPATEVFEGYQKAQELQAELDDVRRTAPPPQEYDRQIYETVQARGKLMQELQIYARLLEPQQPNPEMIRTDPDGYYQHIQIAQQMSAQLNAIRQQFGQHQADQSREQEALTQARFARERGKLHDIWPEVLSNPQRAASVRDAAARHYGIDNQTFATTIDARFYAVLKDALAYRDGIKAQQTAVKVVRAKPKLVRATARSGETGKQMAVNTAMQRAARSGSLEDAADVIGGLLG